jgi:hypothetical protein
LKIYNSYKKDLKNLKKLHESIGAIGINIEELTLDKHKEIKFVEKIMTQIYDAEAAMAGKDAKKLT